MAEATTRPIPHDEPGGDVDAFVAAVPQAGRRADAERLVALLRQVTGEEPEMWGASIIGFGRRSYRYASGRSGQTATIGFSPRSTASVLYLGCETADWADLAPALGPHRTGTGCLYLRRLDAVDPDVLATLLARAVAIARAQPSDGGPVSSASRASSAGT